MHDSKNPLVSVVMSVHNGARFLRDSIESILNQTFADFEFIVIDDGSTDGSNEIIQHYAELDARLVSIRREQKGLTKSLNEGIALARGAFVARQDADDISLPERFAVMVAFMKANPDIAAAGSWGETIDDAARLFWPITYPADHVRISWYMIGGTCILHPSAMLRRDCIAQFGAYDERYIYAQDYELWTRWIRLGARLANIPQRLVKYRKSDSQISTKFFESQSEMAVDIATVYINYLLSDNLQAKEIRGVRQLFGFWAMDEAALSGIPVLIRLLKLPQFRPWIYYAWSTRSGLAANIAKAVQQFGGPERNRARAALLVALLISPRVILERNWWVALKEQMPSLTLVRR